MMGGSTEPPLDWMVIMKKRIYNVLDWLLEKSVLFSFTNLGFWLRSPFFEQLQLESLVQKWVIVTGAGSGLGRETALQVAKSGANVILAVRNLQSGEKVREEILTLGRHKQGLCSASGCQLFCLGPLLYAAGGPGCDSYRLHRA